MKTFCFDAVDENGIKYLFDQKQEGNRILLTLKKEVFANAKKLYLLGSLSEAKVGEDGFYLLPRTIGMESEIITRFLPREDTAGEYAGHMPLSLYGIKNSRICALVRLERSYTYQFAASLEKGIYRVTPFIDLTTDDPAYTDIHVELLLMEKEAGYADMANALRNHLLTRENIPTLRHKCQKEAVDYIRKYPIVRIRLAWKASPSPEAHQTVENEPPVHVACTFARVREIADEMKRQGLEGVDLQLVGWNISGHDGRYPQLFPVEPLLGGEAELRKTIEYVKALGYHISLHTCGLDCYEIADNFTWDDICINSQGAYVQGGLLGGGQSYIQCIKAQQKNARRDLPAVAAMGVNGIHYTDVISIAKPVTCYAENHACRTDESIRIAQEIMAYTRELFGGFSSEGCMDYAIKHLDFGLYISFGTAFGKQIFPFYDDAVPFYEMVYHGLVLYNPLSRTMNVPIKTESDRLDVYLRGGKPTFYIYSKFRTGDKVNWMGETDLTVDTEEQLQKTVASIKAEFERYRPFADRQFLFITNYAFLDGGIEVATYEDGVRIVGNRSNVPASYDGKVLAPWELLVL